MASTNSRIKGIDIEIGGNTTKLQTALKNVNSSLKSTQSALKDVNSLLKLDPSNTELLNQKQELLQKTITETKEKLEQEKQALEQLKNAGNSSETIEQQNALNREIEATTQDLKNAEDAYKQFGSVGIQQAQAVGSKFTEIGGKITSVGTELSKVSAGLVAVGAASVSAFQEVDDAMDTIAKKTGASGDALEAMEDSAKDIAETIPTSFDSAASAIGEVNTRFGLTGDSLQALSQQFVEFAELNDTDVSTSIDNVQNVMAAYGVSTKDASLVLDTMNQVGQNTGITMDELASSMVSNAAALTEMGFSASDAANFLGQCETAGIDTTTVMAGLKKALTNAASEGQTLPEALAGFQETMESSASGTDKLNASIDLFGSKAGAAIYQACSQGSLSLASLDTSLQDASGNVESTYQTTLDGTDEMTTAMNTLKDVAAELGATIGETLAPILQELAEWLKNVKDWYDQLSPGMQDAIVKIGLVVAAIGPLLVIIGTVCSSIGNIISIGATIVTFIGGTLVPIITGTLIPAITTLLACPVTWVILAIVAAIVAIIAIIKNWGAISQWFSELWSNIKDALSETWDGIKTKCTETFNNIKKKISDTWEKAKEKTSDTWENIKDGVSNGVSNVVDKVGNLKDKISDKFTELKDSALSWGADMISNFISGIESGIENVTKAVEKVADKVASYLHFSVPDVGPLSDADKWMPDMVDLMSKTLTQSASNMIPSLKNMASTINGGLNNSINVNTSNADVITYLQEVIPQLSNQNIVLDTGALVGHTARQYDAAIGKLYIQKSRAV